MSAHNDTALLRTFLIILGALIAFTVVIMIAANQITSAVGEARGEDPRLRAAIAERVKPIGSVNVAGAPATAADPAVAAVRSGGEVAALACNACHVAGVLGAPKIGDAPAWNQRMVAVGGIDGLTASAIKGKGSMPARGGAQVSDAEIRAAIEHMLDESGVEVAADQAAPPPVPEPAPSAVVEAVDAAKDMAASAPEAASGMVAAVMPQAAAPVAVAPAAPAPVRAPVVVVPAAAAPVTVPVVAAPATAAPVPVPVIAAPAAPAPVALASAVPAPVAAIPAAPAGPDLAKGKSVYDNACFACHAVGAAGAPKLGDKALWGPRIEKGMDALNTSALNGIGVMPAKGGRVDLPDADIVAAVAYMVEQAK